MQLLDILRLRDRAIKNELMNEVPIERRDSVGKMINKAFQVGSKRWAKYHLPDIFGEKRARRILQREIK